jgi:hypothetical protein
MIDAFSFALYVVGATAVVRMSFVSFAAAVKSARRRRSTAMDAMYAANPGAFQQLATHISIYNVPMSVGFANLTEDVLRQHVGVWRYGKYKQWNVPGMGTMLGKMSPVDIHGWHVVIDEGEINSPDRESCYSTLRYGLVTAAQRRKEGGRKAYDFITMNFALGVGAIFGTAFLVQARKRIAFFQRRPLVTVALSLCIVGVALPVVRSLFKMFTVGVVVAERTHRKALGTITCHDCLGDMLEYTDGQITELGISDLPPPLPGQPPMPEQLKDKFRESIVAQIGLLKADAGFMRSMQKKALVTHGVAAGTLLPDACLCEVHRGLRRDPEGFKHPREFPIFAKDRAMARRRVDAVTAPAS